MMRRYRELDKGTTVQQAGHQRCEPCIDYSLYDVNRLLEGRRLR